MLPVSRAFGALSVSQMAARLPRFAEGLGETDGREDRWSFHWRLRAFRLRRSGKRRPCSRGGCGRATRAGYPDTCSTGCVNQAEYHAITSTIATTGVPNGVKTFAVGVTGSDRPQGAGYDSLYVLSELAVAGGTTSPGCIPTSGTVSPRRDTTCQTSRGTYCHIDLSPSDDLVVNHGRMSGTMADFVRNPRVRGAEAGSKRSLQRGQGF
jgi:hypothetical protein